jgi:hypothetical protein
MVWPFRPDSPEVAQARRAKREANARRKAARLQVQAARADVRAAAARQKARTLERFLPPSMASGPIYGDRRVSPDDWREDTHYTHAEAHRFPTHHVGPCDEMCRRGSTVHAHRRRR